MTLAVGPVFEDELHARSVAIAENNLPRAVRGITFDDQNFEAGAGDFLCQKRIQGLLNGGDLIKNRYDDRKGAGNRRWVH